ncbi:MAG: hypothetical protein ABJ327_24140 [Litoreibacter sp.]
MKNGFTPLILSFLMFVFVAKFWYDDSIHRANVELLATDVEAFLNDQEIGNGSHFAAQQKAQLLTILVHRPNLTFLPMLGFLIAICLILVFFKNPIGRKISQKTVEIWTWRP